MLHVQERTRGGIASAAARPLKSGLLGEIRRRVLTMIRFVRQIAADLAEPVRLHVGPHLWNLDGVILLHVDQKDGVTRVMALRVDADLALLTVSADGSAFERL